MDSHTAVAKPTESLSPLHERGDYLFGFGHDPAHDLTRWQNFRDEACDLVGMDLPVLQISIHLPEDTPLEGRAAR